MERITKKMIEQWLTGWNENNSLQLELACYNGWYHIRVTNGGNNVAEGSTARQCWENFERFRNGYYTALEMVRRGLISID